MELHHQVRNSPSSSRLSPLTLETPNALLPPLSSHLRQLGELRCKAKCQPLSELHTEEALFARDSVMYIRGICCTRKGPLHVIENEVDAVG